jgi:hypothetical protein
VTPLRMRIIRALVLALMLFALTANYAAADEGGSTDVVPYDPGLPGELTPPPAPPSEPFTE